MGLGTAQILFLAVLALDAAVALRFFERRWARRFRERRVRKARSILFRIVEGRGAPPGMSAGDNRFVRRHCWIFLRECASGSDSVRLSEEQRAALSEILQRAHLDVTLIRDLNAARRQRRIRAAAYLPLVPTRAVRISLMRAMDRETTRSVRLFLAAALTDLGESFAIPTMIDTLAGQPLRYQRSLWGLLSEFGDDLAALLPILTMRPRRKSSSS